MTAYTAKVKIEGLTAFAEQKGIKNLGEFISYQIDGRLRDSAEALVKEAKKSVKTGKAVLHVLTRSEMEEFDEENHKTRYDADVRKANEILGKGGFTDFWGFATVAHSQGIMISMATLEDLYCEFVDMHRDAEIEGRTEDLMYDAD